MRLVLVAACAFVLSVPAGAAAQIPAPASTSGPSWTYGVSAGLGRRMTTGTFLPAQLPIGATQPPSPRATASIDLVGGLSFGRRLAVLAMYEGGASLGDAHGWGTLAADAVIRGWVTPRIWIEGGGGVTELAFRAGSTSTSPTSRWWQPGVEAGAGYDLFQGPTIAMEIFVRYHAASFEGVRQQSVSVQFGLLGR